MSPMPMPREDEDKKKFISRCMSNKIMKSEYPDQKQRTAICYSQFKKSKGEKINLDDPEDELSIEEQVEIKEMIKEMFPSPTKEQNDES